MYRRYIKIIYQDFFQKYKQAIVEIFRLILSNDTISPSDLLLFTSKQSQGQIDCTSLCYVPLKMTCWGLSFANCYDVKYFVFYSFLTSPTKNNGNTLIFYLIELTYSFFLILIPFFQWITLLFTSFLLFCSPFSA